MTLSTARTAPGVRTWALSRGFAVPPLCCVVGHQWRKRTVLQPRNPTFGIYESRTFSYESCRRCGGVR